MINMRSNLKEAIKQFIIFRANVSYIANPFRFRDIYDNTFVQYDPYWYTHKRFEDSLSKDDLIH